MLNLSTPPETKNPRDIAIGAGSVTGVKLTSIELTANHSIANSIGSTI